MSILLERRYIPAKTTLTTRDQFRLQTFGAPALRDAEGSVVLRFGKPLAMITYLACAPQRTCARREIVTLLWGDSPDQRASNAFRQTVFLVRQQFGAGAILTNDGDVSLALPLTIDAERFSSAYASADMQQAVDLYEGPFLEGSTLPGALAFEEWAQLERMALASRFHRACEVLIVRHLEQGGPRRAVALAYRLRDADAARQRSWRLLLQALTAARMHSEASLEADAWEDTLRAEGSVPDEESLAVLRAARGIRRNTESTDVLLRTELVGREPAFAALSDAFAAARREGARHVLVAGAAGIGKSRLIEEFALRVRGLRCREASVRAPRADRHVAYALCAAAAVALGTLRGAAGVSAASAAILVGLSPALSAVFPGAAPAPIRDPEELARLRAIAMRELISCVAAEAPLALFLDDLHWADSASLRLLESACAGLRQEPVLVVGTSRENGGGFSIDRRQDVTLTPLTAADMENMLRSVGVAPSAPWLKHAAEVLAVSSGGSPLVALESLRLAMQRGALRSGDDGLECPDASSIDAVLAPLGALRVRLSELAPPERAILELLAVHDAPLDADALSECLGKPPEEVAARLELLVRHQFVMTEPDGVSLAHDELSDEVLRLQTAPTLGDIRDRLARVLMRRASTIASLEDVRHKMSRVVRLLLDANDGDGVMDAVRQYQRLAASRGSRITPHAALGDLLGGQVDATGRALLRRKLPLSARLAGRLQWAAALVALGAVVAAATYARQPGALELASVAPGLGPDGVDGGLLLYPAPAIDITDRLGARLNGKQMVVRARSDDPRIALTGDTLISTDSGRAVFDRLGVRSDGQLPVKLRFETVDGRLATGLSTVGAGEKPPRIELIVARLNGTTIRSITDTLLVKPGEIISGMVETRYTSVWVSTTLIGGSPTWGRHDEMVRLLSYVWSRTSRAARQDSLRLRAPGAPGNYHYIIALGSETNERFLFAGTNWTVGEPRWHDGNDLADIPAATLDSVSRTGTMTAFTLRRHADGREYPSTHGVGIIALPIRVAEPGDE